MEDGAGTFEIPGVTQADGRSDTGQRRILCCISTVRGLYYYFEIATGLGTVRNKPGYDAAGSGGIHKAFSEKFLTEEEE